MPYSPSSIQRKESLPADCKICITQLSNDDDALGATGDLITEDLGSILASVCNGDLSLIKQLIETPKNNEYVHSAALESVAI